MEYTIVEPSFELFEPCTPSNHMEFLEKCIRTCYKSEEHIKEGSAAALMEKVVNKFGHHSVIEHCNVCMWVPMDHFSSIAALEALHQASPLFALSTTNVGKTIYISGNLRLWRRAYRDTQESTNPILKDIFSILAEEYPFFFPKGTERTTSVVSIDTNPFTNQDELSENLLSRHTTLTGRFIGSRTMSHQLVRHRLAAYSQESQRYCNYGKKGFQFIVPPTFSKEVIPDHSFPMSDAEMFCIGVQQAYNQYLIALDRGIPPEDARAILPNATKTEVVATYTLEMWKHVIEHRGHNPKAQWEIRDLCLSAEKQINERLGWNI